MPRGKISENLLRAVDNLVVKEFERGTKTLWRLNCLVHAGAVLICNRVRITTKLQEETHKEEVCRLQRTIGWQENGIRRLRIGGKATA